MLVDSFLQRAGSARHRVSVQPEAMALLQQHDWPGNIRELRNVLDRARLFADDGIVRAEHLPPGFGRSRAPPPSVPPDAAALRGRASADDPPLAEVAADFRGTRRELAAQLGISERSLHRRLKAPGLTP